MLLVAGAVFVLFALLALSASEGTLGKKRALDTVLGALMVAAVVLVFARAGLAWVGIGVALLWSAARRWHDAGRRREPSPRPRAAAPREASPRRAIMSRQEALAVLGLEEGASRERVLAEYRRLMKKVHPDLGGTTYLATRLNEAKDLLLADD